MTARASTGPLLAALTWWAAAAWAGDVHTREYPATVRAVTPTKTFEFPDALATLSDEKAAPQRGGPACELRLAVHDAYFKDDQRVYASERACGRVKRGAKVKVQYLGLATHAQFVSLELDGVWYSLPLMRQTAATTPAVRSCLAGGAREGSRPVFDDGGAVAPRCAASVGPPL